MNYWYCAHENEMFLDLDSRRALRRAVSVLLVAIQKRKLNVRKMFLYPTKQAGHYHMIVCLGSGWVPRWPTKMAWSIWMGNDRLRLAYVFARQDDRRIPEFFTCGDLLMSTRRYYRSPDAVCRCKAKHKDDKVTSRCKAMRRLLGEARSADYFARTGERRVKPLRVRVPFGQVTIDQIKGWLKHGN